MGVVFSARGLKTAQKSERLALPQASPEQSPPRRAHTPSLRLAASEHMALRLAPPSCACLTAPALGRVGCGFLCRSLGRQPRPAWGCLGRLQQAWLSVHPGCARALRGQCEGQLPGSEAGLQKESGSPLAWLTSS